MKLASLYDMKKYPNLPVWEVGIFSIFTLSLQLISWYQNDFHFIYPLDDSYIHLSIANQIAEFGNWGLTDNRFDFSSSGPLFTLFLAGMAKLFGNITILPVIINFLSAVSIIILIHSILSQTSFNQYRRRLFNGLIIFLTPLPLLVLNGMEHCLQLLINLWFIWLITQKLAGIKIPHYYLIFTAFFVGGIRYEGLFIIGISVILLLSKYKIKDLILLTISGLSPSVLFGSYSLSQGGTFLPISVLGKGHSPGSGIETVINWIHNGFIRLWENPFMLVIMGAAVVILWELYRQKIKKEAFYFLLITLPVTIIHSFSAEIGGYRYEAYLVGILLTGIVLGASELNWKKIIISVNIPLRMTYQAFLAMTLISLSVRSGYFHYYYPRATQNIYHQQYQMGQFLAKHFPNSSVAVNDIGAVTYFANIQLTDLVGIGDQAIFEMRKSGTWNKENINSITKNRKVSLAMVHDIWVESIIPPSWQKIGEWIIPDNFICADEKVSFYVVDQKKSFDIIQSFQVYSNGLPEEITIIRK